MYLVQYVHQGKLWCGPCAEGTSSLGTFASFLFLGLPQAHSAHLAHTTGNIKILGPPQNSIRRVLAQTTLRETSPDLAGVLATSQSLVGVKNRIASLDHVRVARLPEPVISSGPTNTSWIEKEKGCLSLTAPCRQPPASSPGIARRSARRPRQRWASGRSSCRTCRSGSRALRTAPTSRSCRSSAPRTGR